MSDEYPKVITVDGVTLTVESAEDETRWRQPAAVTTTAPEEITLDVPVDAPIPDVLDDPDGAPPADPLDDVTIEMDNPTFQPTAKTKGGAKKK